MLRRTTIGFLFFLAVGVSPAAETAEAGPPATQVHIGGKPITLPPPEDFVRVDGNDTPKDRLMAASLPPSNRYLARYEPGDHPDGSSKPGERSFSAQTVIQLENQEIGERTFADAKQQMKLDLKELEAEVEKSVGKLTDHTEKQLSKELGTEAKLDLTDMVILGVFDDSPSSLGFTLAVNAKISAGGRTEKSKQLSSVMMAPVNGRLILLYSISSYTSEADRTWTETTVSRWRDQVVASNPHVQGPSGKSSLFDGVGKSTLVGACIGGCVGLISWLSKKFKRQTA